jgi:hypothetical protein
MDQRNEPDDQHLASVKRLRAVLESLASALAAARLEELLEIEQELARSLAALPDSGGHLAGDPKGLARELTGLRRALVRCRRLGQTLSGLLHASVSSRALGAGYNNAGLVPARTGLRALEERA